MCWSCGCNDLLESDHGDPRSITTATLQGAADAAHTDVGHVVSNIVLALSHFNPAMTKGEEDHSHDFRLVKAEEEQRYLLMVGYSPNRMPRRGADGFLDIASPGVIEKACWRFMLNGAGVGLLHKEGGENAFKVVENYIYRNPVPWVMKAPNGTEQTIYEGDWLIGALCSKETWADVKAGRYGSGSLQGGAKRNVASPETLARQRT